MDANNSSQNSAKLQELDQRKSEFISVVAHQLRTPLAGIKWTFSMLLAGDLGPLSDEQRAFIMKGYETNQRMILLVEDMLSADKVGSGKYAFEFAPAQIADLIDSVLYDLVPFAAKKNIAVMFKRPDNQIPKATMDAEKIQAVLQNLIENAIKYTRPNGKVEISLTHDAHYIRVEIADNGIGIPHAEQSNIFKRFYRAPNAIKQQSDGSGLGLFIAKGIIEQHGGIIWFESEENKGTTFYFTLKIG